MACDAAKARGLKRVGLFGTRSTMQGRFYPDVFSGEGIALVTPGRAERDYIQDKYFGELVKGVILDETRERLVEIVAGMNEREGIEGLILGGTELSLILRGGTAGGVPVLDTTLDADDHT
jgi:aspartate racemase